MKKNIESTDAQQPQLTEGQKEEKVYQIRQSQLEMIISQTNKTVRNRLQEYNKILLGFGAIILIGLYIIYTMLKDNTQDFKIAKAEVDAVLAQNVYYDKNIKALSGTICYNCHNVQSMFLPKTTLNLTQFVSYVRGDRFVTNSVMPIFTDKDISDTQLQEIWKKLY